MSTNWQGKSILVIDDEEALRTMVCEYLSEEGFDVEESSSGEDALFKITQAHFDAIVSDVRMPGMSGFDLMYVLKKLCDDTVLIFLTAVPDPELKLTRLSQAAGVYAYLSKPCKLEYLKNTIENGLADQESRREEILSLDEFSEGEACVLADLITEATQNAISGIAGMVGRDVRINGAEPRHVAASNVADLLKNPEDKLVGISMDIIGDATGHMLLFYPPRVAYGLADLITGQTLGSTTSFDEIGESALKEMGNIAGGFFLNSLADAANMKLMPTPPNLIMGKAGRILDNAFRPLSNKDANVFVVQMTFETNGSKISGYFLALSTAKLMNALLERVNSAQAAVS